MLHVGEFMSWFRQSKTINYVAAVLSTQSLTCGWLEKSLTTHMLILRAYKKIDLNGDVDAQGFFNPTFIGTALSSFLTEYCIPNPTLSCAFTSPLVTERLTTKTHATPHPGTLIMAHTQHALWDYQYIYPTDTDEYVFYLCAVTQPFLLQYKLMAIKHQLPLLTTTSQTAALLQLYRFAYGNAFRSTQLGIDMQRCNNNPERLFSSDMLNRIITIPPHIPIVIAQEKSSLLTMCGLFVSERTE